MSWHSDDEPEWGPIPVIASVSFGTPRTSSSSTGESPDLRVAVELTHGSLLVMAARDPDFEDQVPKSTARSNPRLTSTFRVVR